MVLPISRFLFTRLIAFLAIIHTFATALPKNASSSGQEKPQFWTDAVRRGSILYDQMRTGCFPDKQEPITYDELLAQGWTVNDASGPAIQFPPIPRPPDYSESVKKIMPWTKGDDYYVPPTTSLPSSRYDNEYSPLNGLINAKILIRRSSEPLYWPDVTFAVWQALCASLSTPIKSLRWIVLTEVINGIGTAVLSYADPQGKIAIFEPGTEAYKAIIGTPNWATGSVYLLMEHKRQLGLKGIGRIIVFGGEYEEEGVDWPSVVFEVVDLAAPVDGEVGMGCGVWKVRWQMRRVVVVT
ncbi:MAG: hypothetical protein Q9219_004324 [cf. Caloplaca sp. 3 TL-2023]